MNNIKKFISWIFYGCPICYNIFTVTVRKNIKYCPKCNNNYDIIIWK